MRYKKRSSPKWVKTYKPDDINYTMLITVGCDKNCWPNDLMDCDDNVIFLQLINHETKAIIKHEKNKSGQPVCRTVSKYIYIRLKNIKDETIDKWQTHKNCINYNIYSNEVAFRFEVTDELLDVLQ